MVRGTLGTSSRFLRRQWQRRLDTLRRTLAVVGVLAVVAFTGWVVFFSTWFAADRVQVRGARTVPAAQVVAAADVRPGTPLARVDVDTVHRLVATIPAVASVTVHRSWPHTLTITVTERTPVATIHRGGRWWTLDAKGVEFRPSRVRDPALTVVEVHGESTRAALPEVTAVVTSLPPGVRAQTARITASSMDSITLLLRDGRQVVWGNAAAAERKVQVLTLLLQRPAAVYDVSVPELPTTSGRPPR